MHQSMPVIAATAQDELCKKATKPVHHLLDMSEKVKEILPDAKGLVQVLPPKNIKDAAQPPQGWTKRKERAFQRWVADGEPGFIAQHDVEPIDPDTKLNMERAMFGDMLDQVEMENAIKGAIHASKGGAA
jgi:hypothetical protein